MWDHALPGRLFLTGNDGTSGWEPWVTDGTEAGTRLVRDINETNPGSSNPSQLMTLGDRLYFNTASYGVPLWESDGTWLGTFKVIVATLPNSTYPIDLIRAGSHVFFPAALQYPGNGEDTGVELWAVGPVN